MSEARDVILQRIRQALGEQQAAEEAIPRKYQQTGETDHQAVVARFIERVEDYKASVYQITEAELPATLARVCAKRRFRRLVAPADLPDAWLPADVEI